MTGVLFNFENLKETSYDALPKGNYAVQVESADLVPTSKGGHMVKFVGTVSAGPYKGRKIFDNFVTHLGDGNINKVGYEIFASSALAIGFRGSASDASWLKGKHVGVSLKVSSSEEFGEQNRVSRFIPLDKVQQEPAGTAKNSAFS
jgi:hypothetical protein